MFITNISTISSIGYIEDIGGLLDTWRDMSMTNKLMIEERVPLAVLATTFGVDRKTVVRWADHGYRGERLENYRIGKKRFSTKQAACRFLAAMNGEQAAILQA